MGVALSALSKIAINVSLRTRVQAVKKAMSSLEADVLLVLRTVSSAWMVRILHHIVVSMAHVILATDLIPGLLTA